MSVNETALSMIGSPRFFCAYPTPACNSDRSVRSAPRELFGQQFPVYHIEPPRSARSWRRRGLAGPLASKYFVGAGLPQASAGNRPFKPLAMNSTAIAASMRPMIRVKTLIPVTLIWRAMYGDRRSVNQSMAVSARMDNATMP